MVRFGGNEFINCSVPLAFAGRYFILETGTPVHLISVVLEYQDNPVFEVFKNEPKENPLSEVSKTPTGIVTVSDKSTGRFLYKIRPGSETSVVFGTIKGDEISVKVTDRQIEVGNHILENNVFNGVGAGVVVDETGSIGIGTPIPPTLARFFES